MLSTEEIALRNHLIEKFFEEKIKIKVVVNKYNINNPMIFYGNKLLNCYVKNFKIYFRMDKNSESFLFFHLYDIKNKKLEDNDELELMRWLLKAEHKNYHTIKVKNTNLKLSGFNYLDNNRNNILPENRYPMFAEHNFKIFFDKEYAIEQIESLQNVSELELVISDSY